MRRMHTIVRLLRRPIACLRDRKGAALVEFGLIAPVLAAVVLGVINGATLLLAYNSMHTAVTGGAQYVMSGGQDLPTVQEVTLTAWSHHSSQASVTATKACLCGTVTSDCNTLCTDQSVPQAFINISASDTYTGPAGTVPISATQTVRVR
jgi:Flp pilus assembly protein TadG